MDQANAPSTSPINTPATVLHRPTLANPSQQPPPAPPLSSSNTDKETASIMGLVARGGKEVWRRSLGALWTSESGPKDDGSSRSSRRASVDSALSTGSRTKSLHRTQSVDTSSILYPTLTVHPPPVPHNILIVSLAHVPSAPPTLSNDELFQIVLRRLEPWVGEEGEGGYVLIILSAEGLLGGKMAFDVKHKAEARKLPGVAWWIWKWKRLPHKYRKNVKRFYIVHPSYFTRSLLPFIVPLLSPKSYSKLYPVPSLLALYYEHGVTLKGIDITLPVLEAESQALKDDPELLSFALTLSQVPLGEDSRPMFKRSSNSQSSSLWGFQALSSMVSTAASYVGLPRTSFNDAAERRRVVASEGYWKRDLTALVDECGGKVPPLLLSLGKVILSAGISTEGIFRRAPHSRHLEPLVALLALPLEDQGNPSWSQLALADPLLPPKILCKFLAELASPILRSELYDVIRSIVEPGDIKERLFPRLPPSHIVILHCVIYILHRLTAFKDSTKMNALNLAIVVAPTLISGPDRLEDASMCLEPGKKLPLAMLVAAGKAPEESIKGKEVEMSGQGTVVGMLELWIREYPYVSGDLVPERMVCPVSSAGVAAAAKRKEAGEHQSIWERESYPKARKRRSGSVRNSFLGTLFAGSGGNKEGNGMGEVVEVREGIVGGPSSGSGSSPG
ncbi:hypothetical protein C359_01133 [Cryptococcus neoformans Bt120]|nr:hypothetical protein C359_01133 [Cryptococcus neoformans var. grubii Bt120]